MRAEDFIRDHPLCCYCGGFTPAATIDHQPAKIAFAKKHRPKGLEFPACLRCNGQTAVDECLLAIVARLTGSLRPGIKPDNGLDRALQTVSSAYPDLLPSMQAATVDVAGRPMPAIDLNKKEVNEGLCRIAAKMGLATYYGETGQIAKPGTRVNTLWTHNQRKDGREEVERLLGKFSKSKQLKQGRWDTGDTFFIRYLVEDTRDGVAVMAAAVFHESVALLAQMIDGCDAPPWESLAYTFAPDQADGIKLISQRWA